MSNPNDAYPFVTSTNTTGDTATQGFNSDALASTDPHLANNNPGEVIGLLHTGTDNFIGSDWVHPEHILQLEKVLDKTAATDHVGKQELEHILESMRKLVNSSQFVRPLSPNLITTGGVYLPAPGGAASAITVSRVLAYDPNRYRVTLHPWVSGSGVTGQIWIGKQQGDVGQNTGGQPMGAFPLSTGNANALNSIAFHWADDMYAAPDIANTVDTWLFYVVERYA